AAGVRRRHWRFWRRLRRRRVSLLLLVVVDGPVDLGRDLDDRGLGRAAGCRAARRRFGGLWCRQLGVVWWLRWRRLDRLRRWLGHRGRWRSGRGVGVVIDEHERADADATREHETAEDRQHAPLLHEALRAGVERRERFGYAERGEIGLAARP